MKKSMGMSDAKDEEDPRSKALKAAMGQRQSARATEPTGGITIMLMMPEHGRKAGAAGEEDTELGSEKDAEKARGNGDEMMGEEPPAPEDDPSYRLDRQEQADDRLTPQERALMARLRAKRGRGFGMADRLTGFPEEDYTGPRRGR